MTESFLVLLAGGVLLAAAICDPKEVTINWLQLAGIIALAMAALSVFFVIRREEPLASRHWVTYGMLLAAILLYLGAIHFPIPMGRPLAFPAFLGAVFLASNLLSRGRISVVSTAGVSAMCGFVLMDMLLGHAYLTASRMTIRPFVRLHLALAIVAGLRVICAVGLTMILLWQRPIELFWDRFGILVLTRWLVGLGVSSLFIYMAWDCIRRRATQSATGILYVAGVLIFIGELMALYLLRETGLPF
jgi:hypothetical protein